MVLHAGRAKHALGNDYFFCCFVFRTPIAKIRAELFEGPVSGFEIQDRCGVVCQLLWLGLCSKIVKTRGH